MRLYYKYWISLRIADLKVHIAYFILIKFMRRWLRKYGWHAKWILLLMIITIGSFGAFITLIVLSIIRIYIL